MRCRHDVWCPVVLALLATACTRAQEQGPGPAAEHEPGASTAAVEEGEAPGVAEAGPDIVPHRFSRVQAFVRRDPLGGEVGAWSTLDDHALPGTEVRIACGPAGDSCRLAVEYLGSGPDADRFRLTVVAPGDVLTREGTVEYRGEELVFTSSGGWQAGLCPAEDEAR